MSDVDVRPSTRADDEERDRFVRGVPGGTFFHLAGWRRAVERVMHHAGRDLLAHRDGELVGVLPLMACRGWRGRTNLISVPYAVYGGAVGTDGSVRTALFQEAERQALRASVGHLELRCAEDPGLALPASTLYSTFRRDLPAEPGQVLALTPKKARAEARKARDRHGLELDLGPWFTPDLSRLFHRNKHDLGSPGLPVAFFTALQEEFPGQVAVHLVRRDAEPLAAVMSFLFGDVVLAYYSGTAAGADRRYSASNFMYVALQEWCVEQGYRQFDFGRSRRDSGAHAFKVHQGFEPAPLHYRYRLVRSSAPPSLNPSNPRTKILTGTWRRLPVWLTRRLSVRASRYLP